MASWTCLLFLTLFCIISGFDCSFVYLECNKDSHGRLGQQSLLECIVKGNVLIESIDRIIWKKGANLLINYLGGGHFTSEPGFTLAEPSWNENNLNVSMLLNNTTIADIGIYTCIVTTKQGHCMNSTTLGLSAIVSSPIIGVTESTQKVLTPSDDGVSHPDRRIGLFDEHSDKQIDPHPESQLAYKVVPPVVVALLIIGLLFFLKRRYNKRTHEEIPTDNQIYVMENINQTRSEGLCQTVVC